MATETFNNLRPRREATPLRWNDNGNRDHLTGDQRDAARQLWALFQNYYLDEAPAQSRYGRASREGLHRVLPAIDDQRHNQTILIDGGRGSGKTALLITLIDGWNRRVRGEPDERGLAEVCDPDGRVVPIGLLDLRSLPNHVSLLIHVAGLLRSLVEELGIHRADPPPPTSPHAGKTSAAQVTWQRFLAATASTEQSMRMRSAALDPESFAAELHETEQDRLHIGDQFSQLMDHIVSAYEKRLRRDRGHSEGPRDTPVFVIAIDDADMNPARLGECFELLDSFVHPRLVFILTGDEPLFLTGLRARFLGELRQPLAGAKLDAADRKMLGDIPRALELAQQYYNKLLPPHHCCKLSEVSEGERLEHLREALEDIPLGPVNICTVFDRVRMLGALLPDSIRDLEDFRQILHEYAGAGDQAALKFLVLIKNRVAQEAGPSPDFEPTKLILLGSQPLFGPEALFTISTRALDFQSTMHEYAAREIEPSDHTALWTTRWFGTLPTPRNSDSRHNANDDNRDHDADLLLSPQISNFALFIEYTAPHIQGLEKTFRSRLSLALPAGLSTRFHLEGFGAFSSSWPLPLARRAGWRNFEFIRLWHRALTTIVGIGTFNEDQIELLAINYIRIIFHVLVADLGTDDPPVLRPRVGARTEVWQTTIKHARESGSQGNTWSATQLLEMAYPESRLGNDAARRLLSAWESIHNTSEETVSADSLLVQANRVRWSSLNTKASAHRDISPMMLHSLLIRHFKNHPWTKRFAAFGDVDLVAPIREALTNIMIPPEPSAPWVPTNAAGYLAHYTAELLNSVGTDIIDPISRALNYWYGISGNSIHALFRGWQVAALRNRSILRWEDFFVDFLGRGLAFGHGSPINSKPVASAIPRIDYLLYEGHVFEAAETAETLGALAMYRLIYDVSHDALHQQRSVGDSSWALFRVHWRGDNDSHAPWPAVSWLTHIDYDVITQRWVHLANNTMSTEDNLGVIARRYVEAQIHTFSTREVYDTGASPMSWPEVFEFARSIYDRAPSSYARTQSFGDWMRELDRFGQPGSALPTPEAAAALIAFLELIVPMQPLDLFGEFSTDNVVRGKGTHTFKEHPWTTLHDLPTHQERRDLADDLRSRFGHEAPERFAPPAARIQAIAALREALQTLELPSAAARPNVGAYLSNDLIEAAKHIYTGSLMSVVEELHMDDSTTKRLTAAWQASKPETPDLIRHDSKRWVVQGTYTIGHDDRNEGQNVSIADDLTYNFNPGTISTSVDEDFATIIHALIHDVARDTQPTGETLSPRKWALARVTLGESNYAAWPAVQWPTRYDMALQLRSWQVDLERRTHSTAESMASHMRNFVASTAHIFRARTVHEHAAGSWRDVIQAAWDARSQPIHVGSDRRLAYEAWVEQLPRLALPRAGLSHKYAADVLVRHFDITEQNPQPQLKQDSIAQTGEQDLTLGDRTTDHPATLLADCTTETQLHGTIEHLRTLYELA